MVTKIPPGATSLSTEATRPLEMSAAEFVATRCSSGEAIRLAPKPAALLERIPGLGPVTAESASRYAILESVGTYGAPDIGDHTGIVIGENIDLRIFPSGWSHAYAVTDAGKRGPERSIQVFDGAGRPAHTIRLRPESDLGAFERLVRELAIEGDRLPFEVERDEQHVAADDATIDVAAYRNAFAAMQDTHDFFMLLRRFGLAREQGLRLTDPAFALPLERDAHRQLFARATAGGIPLMLFVANDGMVQISSGVVPAATIAEARYCIAGERFKLTLHETGVARAWAVRKPTASGIVTSLELYDASGTLILQVFGERHEGSGERPDWARAIRELEPRA